MIDRVMPEKPEFTPEDLAVVLSDLSMLRGPGGCERTADEFRALLAKGRFRMGKIVPTGRYFIIEAACE